MNRRNFILGLGTAATLSGAASVTGASLSNTVDAGADFRIVATNELNVQRNNELEDSSGNFDVSAPTNYSDQNGNFSTDPVDMSSDRFPNLTVNDLADGGLNMSFTTDNEATSYNQNDSEATDTSASEPYNGTKGSGRVAPLEIVNEGGSDKDVAVQYTYGSDATTSPMSTDKVCTLFEFEINGTQVSPDADGTIGSNGTTGTGEGGTAGEGNAVTIPAGESKEVDFLTNYNQALVEDLSEVASGGSDFGFGSNTANAAADLLEAVTFGTA